MSDKCNRFGLVDPYDPEFRDDYDDTERDVYGKNTRTIVDDRFGDVVAFINGEKLGKIICELLNSKCILETVPGEHMLSHVLPGYECGS